MLKPPCCPIFRLFPLLFPPSLDAGESRRRLEQETGADVDVDADVGLHFSFLAVSDD